MAQNKSQQAQIEEEMLAVWAKEKTFQKSLQNRKGQKVYTFYDGPPFANGLPHFGHSLVTSIKDSVLRYKTMRGYYVPRRNGWDCHGLPVEFAIENDFGVSGKKQIMELGLEKFNSACRDSIFKYKGEWEGLLQRLGRWSDYENYYATVDTNYTESVWWALGQIHDKGLLYKGYKSAPYCPRCETPLSNFEVNEGYRDNVPDPSLFVKFKLEGEDASLLAWTTTPWSLPGNAAVAINPNEAYVYVEYIDDNGQNDTVILAKSRLEALDEQEYKIIKEVQASQLAGKKYQPLFKLSKINDYQNHEKLYKIWLANFVSVEDGTGVLHVAPAFGEDDLNLGQENDLPVLTTIDASGHVEKGIGFTEAEGKFFKSADKLIIEHLTREGRVFAAETAMHTYPFCWRCETPLLYYAISSWFIKVSEIRPQLLKTAEKINWTPDHIKEGRFGRWLEGAKDWAISRNRYWGAPLPIWVNEEDENDYIVVKSITELQELAEKDQKLDDLHRPFIDEVKFTKDGKTYKRVEEVLDCWFESGCMSFAQHHYPFENKEVFKQSFPADFIIEGLDQTRLWFYVQHVVNTLLFDSPAYKNVVVNGMIMAADGQKLSKRLKNYPPLEDVFNSEGADTLRLFLLSSTQATQTADYMRFDRNAMKDVNRNVIGTLQNSFKFFKMYADIDKWQPPKNGKIGKSSNILDEWILARLNETIDEVTKKADDYKIAHAIEPVFKYIDDLSNWYIRRSRRRFWKSEDDGDKKAAYETLWLALTRVCQLLAPWAPFISDKLYRELISSTDLPQSVHLSDWPGTEKIDLKLVAEMNVARVLINEGLAQRAEAKIKVRQPLSKVVIEGSIPIPDVMKKIIAEELNVKEAIFNRPTPITDKTPFTEVIKRPARITPGQVRLDVVLTDELKAEGLMRELVRFIQNARKTAGLEVDNRINLAISTEDELLKTAIKTFTDTIKAETLAKTLSQEVKDALFTETVKVNGAEAIIGLSKV